MEKRKSLSKQRNSVPAGSRQEPTRSLVEHSFDDGMPEEAGAIRSIRFNQYHSSAYTSRSSSFGKSGLLASSIDESFDMDHRREPNSSEFIGSDQMGSIDAYDVPKHETKEKAHRVKARFLQCIPNAHTGPVDSLVASPEGGFFASASSSATNLCVWRVLQAVKEELELMSPPDPCESTNLCPSGPRLLSSEPWLELKEHQKGINSIVWNDSQFLLSGSDDCTAMLWHAHRDNSLCVLMHNWPVTCVDFVNDSFVATATTESIYIWSLSDRRNIFSEKTQFKVSALLNLPEPKYLFVGGFGGELNIYAFNTDNSLTFHNKIDCKRKRKTGKRVTGISPVPSKSPSGNTPSMVLVSTQDSRIRLFSLEAYACIDKLLGCKLQNESASAMTESGFAICGGEDGKVHIWELGKSQQSSPSLALQKNKRFISFKKKFKMPVLSFPHHTSSTAATVMSPPGTYLIGRESDLDAERKDGDVVSPVPLDHIFFLVGGSEGHIHIFQYDPNLKKSQKLASYFIVQNMQGLRY